jgi:hypothetical protein
MFGDIKEIITELILCLYNKLTDSMGAMMADLLKGAFPLEDLLAQAQAAADNDEIGDGGGGGGGGGGSDDTSKRTAPKVPMCYAEDLVGQTLAAHKEQIGEANQTILDNVSTFISDIQDELAGVTDMLSNITSPLGDIMGSITAALGFENLVLNILGCELAPSCPVADYYTLEDGGAAQSDTQDPSAKGVDDATAENAADPSATPDTPNDPGYVQPTNAQGDQDLTKSEVVQSPSEPSSASGGGNNDDLTKTVDPSTSQISTSGRTQEQTDDITGTLDIY